MNLRLVSSSNNRALTIRDRLLPLVRERGTLENQRGLVRLIVLEMGLWKLHHWAPFNELSPGEASSPGYRHALELQHTRPDLPYGLDVWHGAHTRPDLPYGLDVWHGAKVLGVLWADDGAFEVVTFQRRP